MRNAYSSNILFNIFFVCLEASVSSPFIQDAGHRPLHLVGYRQQSSFQADALWHAQGWHWTAISETSGSHSHLGRQCFERLAAEHEAVAKDHSVYSQNLWVLDVVAFKYCT